MATPDAQPSEKPVLLIRSVCKTHGSGETAVHALRDVSLEVRSGEFIVLLGASGSGKSALLKSPGPQDAPGSEAALEPGPDDCAGGGQRHWRLHRQPVGGGFAGAGALPVL